MNPAARPSTARPEEFDEFDTYYDYDDMDAPASNDRMIAMLAHLLPLLGFSFVAPLVIYLVKKDESAFVADQAKEALNFQITLFIAIMVSVVLIVVLIGVLMLMGIGLAALVLGIVAAIRANDGERYRYPFTIRLIR